MGLLPAKFLVKPPGQPLSLAAKALPFCAAVAVLLAVFVMRKTDLRGDEYTYVAGASALGDWLAGRLPWGEAFDRVIGPGWFMPGTAAIGAPLFALIEAPPPWLVRGWALAVNLALYAATVRAFGRAFGPVYRAALLLFPMLVASWHVSLVTLMPDIPAGLFAALALLVTWRIAAGKSAGWKGIAGFELLLAAAIYLRGPMVLLALALHVLLLALVVSRPQPKGNAGAVLAGLAGLALIISPWSVAATRHFGEPILTTTNVPLVFAESFGNSALTCFGPCAAGQDIWPEWQYAQNVSRQTGENPLAVQRRMMAASIEGLTPVSYLDRVRQHFGTFLFRPDGLVPMYMEVAYAVPPAIRPMLVDALHWLTLIAYLPFVLALLTVNIVPIRRSDDTLLEGLLIKTTTAVLFLQPFFHHTSARYWQTFAPLAAWSAALLVTSLMRPASAGPRTLPAWLDGAQIAYAGVFVAIAITLVVAGIVA